GRHRHGILANASPAASSPGVRLRAYAMHGRGDRGDTRDGGMNRIRKMTALACLCAALATGPWLAGVIALRLLGLADEAAGWTTYFDYLRALGHPALAPHAGRIRWAGVLGMGLPLLAAA